MKELPRPAVSRRAIRLFKELKGLIREEKIFDVVNLKFDFSDDTLFVESYKKWLEESLLLNRGMIESAAIKVLHDKIAILSPTVVFASAGRTIIEHLAYPSILICGDKLNRTDHDPWQIHLENFETNHSHTFESVGVFYSTRVSNGSIQIIGTGWLLQGTDIVVTCNHVARKFAEEKNGNLIFRRQFLKNKKILNHDYFAENCRSEEKLVDVVEILYLASTTEKDIALLRISAGHNIPGIILEDPSLVDGDFVCTIGFPVEPDEATALAYSNLVEEVFGTIFNVKRFSPGTLMGTPADRYVHTCSTLPGSSGSPLINLLTGKVIGMHERGIDFAENHAVKGTDIQDVITTLLNP